jgi:hypothetical protein
MGIGEGNVAVEMLYYNQFTVRYEHSRRNKNFLQNKYPVQKMTLK